MLGRLKEILFPAPKQISAEEKQFRINKAFKDHPLNNGDILYAIIFRLGSLSQRNIYDLADSYETYKSVYPDDNPPVSLHLDRIGLSLTNLPFLKRVSLNYDGGIGAKDRLVDDFQALREGRLKPRFPGFLPSIEVGAREYQNVEGRIIRDLDSLTRLRSLRRTNNFNQKEGLPEICYSLIRNEIWDPSIIYEAKVGLYEKEVIPFLEPEEVIRPHDFDCMRTFLPPTIVSVLAPTLLPNTFS